MQKHKLTRCLTVGIAATALLAGAVGARMLQRPGATAFAAEAEAKATALLGRDGSATGSLDGKKMPISPWADGSVAYQFRAQQLEFKFAPAIDASWAQTQTGSEYKVKDNIYLQFWIYSQRPQAESAWSGDNQIEIASRSDSNHDFEEYHWRFSDVVFQRGDGGTNAYVAGKWNLARLRLTPETGSGTEKVDLGAIKYLRMYYLFNTVEYTDPVFVSDVRLTTGTEDDLGIIREYKDASQVKLPDTLPMPEGKTEGDVVTLPMPEVKDHDGKRIPESKISVVTFGPNGYESAGRTIELEDGNGVYTTRYTVVDLMGNATSKDYTFSVAKASSDRYAPKILVGADMPADFMVADRSYLISDYVNVTDNYGYRALSVDAKITDPAGKVAASFAKASGEDKKWELNFAPTEHVEYTLQITATDAANLTSTKEIALKTYLPAQTDRAVRLFEGDDLELMSGNYYSGRLVDAVPKDGGGTTVSFHYKGGATDLGNNEAHRQEMILMNNTPADVSEIDLRWAAIRLNIYVDRRYANDNDWMPSNGSGYGNMGIGFSSFSGIYDVPRIEYSVNDLRLQAGWNEVTIKLGRAFNGTVDYNALCEMYLYTNFGSERHMLLNDVRLIETDAFGEGFPTATDTLTYVRSSLISAADKIGDATVTLDDGGIYQWSDTYYNGNEIKFPGLVVTDAMGKSDLVENPGVTVTAPNGTVTESMYFTPDTEGVHTIRYTATDWYGKPVELIKNFTVAPWNAMPVIETEKVENDLGDLVPVVYECRVGKTFRIPSLRIYDAGGEAIVVTYRVTAPDGKPVTLEKDGKSFRTALPGNYIVTVIAKDEVGQIATEDLTVRSYNVTETGYYKAVRKETIAWAVGGGIGGLVVLSGIAVTVVLVLRKKKNARATDAAETENYDADDERNE